MKKTLTVVNNIVCAILLVATFATMLIPCWDFVAEEKIKVKTCRDCGLAVELTEGQDDLPEDYVCPGTKLVDPNAKEEEEEPATEATEATEAVEATEGVAVAAELTAAPAADPTEATEAVEATEPAAEVTEPIATEPTNLVEVPCGATGKRSFKSSTTKKSFDDSASVMEYTWLAYDNEGLTADFEEQGYKINDLILAPFLLTICVIAGTIACLLNMKGTWHSVFPLAGGVATVITYLKYPIMQTGSWMTTLGCAIALSVAGLLLFIQLVIKIVKWFTVRSYKK